MLLRQREIGRDREKKTGKGGYSQKLEGANFSGWITGFFNTTFLSHLKRD